MARQPESSRSTSALLTVEAKRLSESYGITTEQAQTCLQRLVNTFDLDLSENDYGIRRSLSKLLAYALASLPPERAVALISNADLHDLVRRIRFTAYLMDDATPVYSLPELADHLNTFSHFLRDHRDFITETGLPPQPFRPSRWLYLQLGRLYDTRCTTSPWPFSEFFTIPTPNPVAESAPSISRGKLTTHSGLDRLLKQRCSTGPRPDAPPYEWVQTPGDCHLGSDVRISDYHRADFLNGMDAQDGLRLEELRPSLFTVKMKLLERLTEAARRGRATELWSDCLTVLRAELDKEHVDFCLQMDRFYLGRDVCTPQLEDDNPKLIPGGLTHWLEVIGHVEKEITLGTLANTRAELPDAMLEALMTNVEGCSDDCYYLHMQGKPEQQALDRVLDVFVRGYEQEAAFWSSYRQRVEEALSSVFHASVPVSIRPQHVALLTPLLQKYADHVRSRLDRGEWFDQPPLGLQLFRCNGKNWTICYGGRLIGMPDSIGLFYIHLLLERQGHPIHVKNLRSVYQLWANNRSLPLHRLLDQVTVAAAGGDADVHPIGNDLGEPIDKKAIESCEKKCRDLAAQIAAAKAKGDQVQAEKLRNDQQQIEQYLQEARGHRGQKPNQADPNKRDRNAVCKAINEALDALAQDHRALHDHLQRTLTVTTFCRYQPENPVVWEL